MKRLWFAVIFLCIALALSVFEQYKVHTFYNTMSEKLVIANSYDKEDNEEMLKASIDDIQQYWLENNDILFTLTNHGVLDELSKDIRAINPDNVDNSLYKVNAMLNVFYENERITLSNIF